MRRRTTSRMMIISNSSMASPRTCAPGDGARGLRGDTGASCIHAIQTSNTGAGARGCTRQPPPVQMLDARAPSTASLPPGRATCYRTKTTSTSGPNVQLQQAGARGSPPPVMSTEDSCSRRALATGVSPDNAYGGSDCRAEHWPLWGVTASGPVPIFQLHAEQRVQAQGVLEKIHEQRGAPPWWREVPGGHWLEQPGEGCRSGGSGR